MSATKKVARTEPPKRQRGYVPGTMGGRGPHPKFPDDYPKDHWPLPLPHERGDYKGSSSAAPPPLTKPERARSSTGLMTLDDFVSEAKVLGVYDQVLHDKFVAAFDSAPNEGMRRMRCGNLLCNATKRAGK